MSDRTIYVDIDDVLCETAQYCLRIVEREFGKKVEFRIECFNLTNTPSFSAPATAIDTATAGRVTSTFSTPRQVQLGLKFNF